jgi:hypothetical protein
MGRLCRTGLGAGGWAGSVGEAWGGHGNFECGYFALGGEGEFGWAQPVCVEFLYDLHLRVCRTGRHPCLLCRAEYTFATFS